MNVVFYPDGFIASCFSSHLTALQDFNALHTYRTQGQRDIYLESAHTSTKSNITRLQKIGDVVGNLQIRFFIHGEMN